MLATTRESPCAATETQRSTPTKKMQLANLKKKIRERSTIVIEVKLLFKKISGGKNHPLFRVLKKIEIVI